jgi:acetate kinase
MKILITNVGSTSLKYGLYEMPSEELQAQGRIERVGEEVSTCSIRSADAEWNEQKQLKDFPAAIEYVKSLLVDEDRGAVKSLSEIDAVGFKVVHAKGYSGCQILDDAVLQAMRDFYFVSPIHNPPYVNAIEQFRASLPDTPLVGLFETAFHLTMPAYADTYGIPFEWKEKYGIRRFGFHGASHAYVAGRVAERLQKEPGAVNAITCHLGGSSSITAIRDGISLENSFGFSSQSGLSASTRCGDIDPYIIPYVAKTGDYSLDEVCDLLARDGGLKGIAGMDPDMRMLEQAASEGNERAKLAIETFVYSIKKFIGAYAAVLERVDALAFAGGIGERSVRVRAEVCRGLEILGMRIDEQLNERENAKEACISLKDSPTSIWIVPTNEEVIVARAVAAKLKEMAGS